MYSQLGLIIFDKVFSPSSQSDELEISWAEFETINQPTKLQPTGRGLVEMELEMFLHQSFCNVADQVKTLTDAAVNYDVMPLLWGNGKLEGDFIISNISKKTEQKDELGNLIGVTVTVTLKEYIADKLETQQANAKNNAFATGNKKGVTDKKNNTQNISPCNKKISKAASSIKSYATRINKSHAIYQASQDLSNANQSARVIANDALKVSALCKSMIDENAQCLQTHGFTNMFSDIGVTAYQLYLAATAPFLDNPSVKLIVKTRHQEFQVTCNNALLQFSGVISSSIARRPD